MVHVNKLKKMIIAHIIILDSIEKFSRVVDVAT